MLTLTFSEDGITALRRHGAKLLQRNFLAALRASEKAAGNPQTIRCFGALEYGEVTLRPHIHLLAWNLMKWLRDSTPYRPNLPRPRYLIGPWPHGHVDYTTLSPNSCRYVCKYVTKFESSEDRPTVFRPQRPPLGLLGFRQHMLLISRSPARSRIQKPVIKIDGKNWPLDHRWRAEWLTLCRKYNLKTDESVPQINIMRRGVETQLEGLPEYLPRYRKERKKILTTELLFDHTSKKAVAAANEIWSKAIGKAQKR